MNVSFFTINLIYIHIKSSSLGKYIIIIQQYLLDFVNIAKKMNKIGSILIKLCIFSLRIHQGKKKKYAVGH